MRRRTAGLAAIVLLTSACGLVGGSDGTFSRSLGPTGPTGTPASPDPGDASSTPSPGGASADCPARYAEPDPNRPRIRLSFTLSADLSTVTGTEHVDFTPDLPVTELVFRLTANTAPSADEGNSIKVTSATASPGGAPFTVDSDGAGGSTQGGLLRIPLGQQVAAGQQVSADLAFVLKLGDGAFDRFGRSGPYAWWGSGQPLLAWERGVGWHTEPMLKFVGESATSEAAQIDLTVLAPAKSTVLTSGTADQPVDADGGLRRWHAVADRARDVSVAVGPFAVKTGTVAGTTLTVGTPRETPPAELYGQHQRALEELGKRFGPFPFPALTVARLPIGGGGIEYPGSILMLADDPLVAVHETAHQWFYAMVGDSQARDPWLDEAFATYAEQLVNHDGQPEALNVPGKVGDSMQGFGDDSGHYYNTVYAKGSAALAAARTAAGPAKFDAALRCYVNKNAWRIAKPADLAAALSGLPAAMSVLRKAGALP
jgi:hypothetical protein